MESRASKSMVCAADGFGACFVAMRGNGVSEQDVDRMSKRDPARLLGLP